MKSLLWITFVVMVTAQNHSITDDPSEVSPEVNPEVKLTFDSFERKIKDMLDDSFRRVLPTILRSSSGKVSFECTAGLLKLVQGLRQLQDWALKVVDASGKPPGGILEGTLSSFGSFDECLSVLVPSSSISSRSEAPSFRGKYCTVQFHPPEGLFDSNNDTANTKETKPFQRIKKYGRILRHSYFRLGVCVPDTCSSEDVHNLLKTGVSKLSLQVKVRRCETKQEFEMSDLQIGLVCCFLFLFLAVAIGTTVDILSPIKTTNGFKNGLVSFSLKKNVSSLLETQRSMTDLTCLNGIRFLTSLWIILGHNYLLPVGVHYMRFRRVLGYIDFQKEFAYAAIANFYLSVDTFFLISGLLAIYSRKREFSKLKGKISFASFVLKRLWRITPTYLVTIGVFLLMPLFGSGPMWYDAIESQTDICKKNWWTNLLFIQNFWPIKENCFFASWYLACTIQIHVLSFLILWPLFKNYIAGIVMNSAFLIGSIALTAYVTFAYQLRPTLDPLGGHKALDGVTSLVYIRPYAHMPAFAVGLFFGLVIIRIQNKKLSKVVLAFGSLICLALNMSVVYGLFDYYKGADLDKVSSVIYAATHRGIWAVSVGWLILICSTGNGSFVNSFLSWRAFIPMGKLSFAAYLIHPLIILYQLGRVRERIYLGHFEMVLNTIGVSCVSYFLAVVLYSTVELPSLRLEQLAISMWKRKKSCNLVNKEINGACAPEMGK